MNKTEHVADLLASYPSMSADEIAQTVGVSVSHVCRVNRERNIRPPGVRGGMDREDHFAGMAWRDLRDALPAYEDKRDRVGMLKGYIQAATALLNNEQQKAVKR